MGCVCSMMYLYLLVLFASLFILVFMLFFALKYPKTILIKVFSVQVSLIVLWTLATILEIGSSNENDALLWRNIQQIAVFYVPLISWIFTIEYTHRFFLRRSYYPLAIIQTIGIILIFTNPYHHIMRTSYQMMEHPLFGQQIVVDSTLIGEIWVTFNFLMMIFACIIMLEFSFHVSSALKKQVAGVTFSLILSTVFAWLKTAYLESKGIYIPISVVFLPSSLILYYVLFKYQLFQISPIARNKVFDVIQDGILVVDTKGRIADYNPYFLEILKNYFSSNQVIMGEMYQDLMDNKIEMDFDRIISRSNWEIEVGNQQFLRIKSHPIENRTDVLGYVLIISEITESKLRELDLLIKTQQDPMTALLNRNGLMQSINNMLGNDGWGKLFSLLIFDLDNFKKINDENGHLVGDQVIIHFSKQLRKLLGPNTIIARLGGEEFIVVLPLIDKYKAFEVGERIRAHIENTPLEYGENQKLFFTVSVGISDSSEANHFNQLIDQADQALYQAKRTSRNNVFLYSKT